MISVCLASYNGEKYIAPQLRSILSQLPPDAELIVSDDASSDATRSIVSSFADVRLRLVDGPCRGVVANFEHAISLSRGDVIFLADQDDLWLPEKVTAVLSFLEAHPSCQLVLHDAVLADASLNTLAPSFFAYRRVKKGLWQNLLRNSYTGCCMAFRAGLKSTALPFPKDIEMHDWWLGLVAEQQGVSAFLPQPLILYRRHEGTATTLKHYPINVMLSNRIVLLNALLKQFLLKSTGEKS